MRNKEFCEMFVSNENGKYNGKKCNSMHISEDGNKIFSYGTCLAQRLSNGTYVVNDTKYSVTTSRQQTMLNHALRFANTMYLKNKIPMWTKDLRMYL
jgi:hypothetical protein